MDLLHRLYNIPTAKEEVIEGDYFQQNGGAKVLWETCLNDAGKRTKV